MDLTRPISYRNFDLNNAALSGGIITGCQIDRVDYPPVEAVGYREKRSLSDGIDVSDVFLGGRNVILSGKLYGSTRGDFYDRLEDLRACFLPTAAYAESPAEYGYLPLLFDEPTADTVTWPTGFITKMIRVRPLATPHIVLDRDRLGGDTDLGFSCEWSVALEARDPRIYYQDDVTTYFNANGNTSSGSGSVTNRGPYPAPLNILVAVPGGANTDRVLTLTAFGTVVKITVPTSSNDRIARYNGVEKYLTLEEQGVETLRMDLLTFPGALSHPLVPSGANSYSWTYKDTGGVNKNINGDSRFWFEEAWA